MGRSDDNTYVKNPAKFTVQWAGADGFFQVYDAEAKEKIALDGLSFAWVEDRCAITGYNEPSEFFIRSNEISGVRDEELSVFHYVTEGEGENRKSKKVVDHVGFYADIKDAVKSKEYGGRYTTITYGVSDGDYGPIKKGDIIRIEISGCALNAWIDKGFDHREGGVGFKEAIPKKKGRVDYFQPVFVQETVSAEVDALANEADKLLKAWVSQDSSSAKPEEPDTPDEYEDDIPF